MIKVNVGELFPVTALLIDEELGEVATGKIVYYDIRKQPGDLEASPPINGVLPESTVTPGVYTKLLSIPEPGSYLYYATCSGFLSSTEEIIVESENLADLIKQNRTYNLSVEDVVRQNVTPTASQIARNVPLGLTDYVLTRVKLDDANDWTTATISGAVFAHYTDINAKVPYKMGDDGL